MGDLMSSAGISTPTIRQGLNAGKPRPLTDAFLDRMRPTFLAVCRLRSNGYAVRDVQIIGRARPVVFVEYCALCDEMIETHRAAYRCDGRDPRDNGRLRVGQFLIEDLAVHVEWEDRRAR